LLGDWVFGCDICQEVCPWNADPEPGDPALEAKGDPPRLAELMRMSREEFLRRFAGTSVRRTGWSRLLRNVAVALGNCGDPAAIPVLEEALRIPDPLIHEHVRWALERLRVHVGSTPLPTMNAAGMHVAGETRPPAGVEPR
jgi:epoxyqueuosine reductase